MRFLLVVSPFRSSGRTKASRQPRCIGEWIRDFDGSSGVEWRDEQDVLVLCSSDVRTSFAWVPGRDRMSGRFGWTVTDGWAEAVSGWDLVGVCRV